MEGGGWFNAQTQRVSRVRGAGTQRVRRAAPRTARRGRAPRAGCAGWGRGRRPGPGAGVGSRAGGPGRPGGGRLTPAAERLHGEDAPPAQHGPAPGPDAAPRPRPLQPPRDPGPRPPAAVGRAALHARPAPAGRGPRTLPAGARGRGGQGGGARRCAGGGGAEWGRGGQGRGRGAGRRGARGGAEERPGCGVLRAPGCPTLPPPQPRNGDVRLGTLPGSRCGVTRHPPLPVHMLVCLPAAETKPGMGVEGRRRLDSRAEGNAAPRAGCTVVPALPAVCLGQVPQPFRNLTRKKGEMIPVHMEILSNCRAPCD